MNRENSQAPSREYGIDVARVLAMFFVVLLHNLYYGNLLNHGGLSGLSWMSAWFLESLASVAVNLFAMITGYLSINRSFKPSRLFEIVLQSLFWAWACLILAYAGGIRLPANDVLQWLIPVHQFWYVDSYVGLLFLVPFLQAGVDKLSQKRFFALLVALLGVSGTFGFIGAFDLKNGYCAYWLVVMYLTGAYLKRYPLKLHHQTGKAFVLYLLMTLVSTLLEFVFFQYQKDPFIFIRYVSPLVIVGSVSLFVALSGLNIRVGWARRLLRFFAPISFGVYLIDSFVLKLPNFGNSFINAGKHGILAMYGIVLIGTAVMFVVFALADEVRLAIFRLVHMRYKLKKCDRFIKDQLYRWSSHL